ncbi:MAG: CDP-diacylglycerol--glycerol-3-phosphate 3-phosphatidyltransferase [Negativibacillus sp.]
MSKERSIDPNLPNKLTMLRIIMIPLFVLLYEWQSLGLHYLWAFIVFALASITDLFDGKIARKYNLISDFGKLMDPLADKVLVTAAMVCFVGDAAALTPSWVVIVILAREFLVTSLRLLAAAKGVVLAADKWGKYKTATTMVWICWNLLILEFGLLGAVGVYLHYGLMFLSLFFTVYSGLNYVVKNKTMFGK